jgi:hypothetical protein
LAVDLIVDTNVILAVADEADHQGDSVDATGGHRPGAGALG